MFETRVNKTGLQAAFAMMDVIYHVTARSVRGTHSNAVFGLILNIIQTLLLVAIFYFMAQFFGMRSGGVRGDYLVYLLTGVMLFMTNVQTLGKVTSSGKSTSALLLHAPLNTFIMIVSSALSVLYIQILSAAVLLTIYDILYGTVQIEDPVRTFMMFLLAWLNGMALGVVLLSITPWFPTFTGLIGKIYTRTNMFTSGKMFLGNSIPASMLWVFSWNPLFHIIDQARGFAFINYSPHNSNLTYPIVGTIAFMMLGFILESRTRKSASLSWRARD